MFLRSMRRSKDRAIPVAGDVTSDVSAMHATGNRRAPGRGASSGRLKRALRVGGRPPLSQPTLLRLVDLCWLVPAHSRTCPPLRGGGLFVNQRNLICRGRLEKRQRPPLPVEVPKPRPGPPLPASGADPLNMLRIKATWFPKAVIAGR